MSGIVVVTGKYVVPSAVRIPNGDPAFAHLHDAVLTVACGRGFRVLQGARNIPNEPHNLLRYAHDSRACCPIRTLRLP